MSNDDLILSLGITEAKIAKELARLEARMIRTAGRQEKAFNQSNARVVQGISRANQSASRFASGGLRNVSMQLSQVAQQASATGQPLRALAIQLPDLALGFGPLGILIGAAAGALIPLAANAFSASEATEDLAGTVESAYSQVEGRLKAAQEAQERYSEAIRLSGTAQSEVTPQILDALRREAVARQALFELERATLEQQMMQLEQSLAQRRAELEQLMRDATATMEAGTGDPFNDQGLNRRRLESTIAVLDANRETVLEIRRQAAALEAVRAQLELAGLNVDDLIEGLKEGETAANGLADADMAGGINAALDSARALADQLGIAYSTALAIQNVGGGGASGPDDARSQLFDQGRIGGTTVGGTVAYRTPSVSSRGRSRSGRSGGGGGGSATDKTSPDDILKSSRERVQALQREIESLGRTQSEVAGLEAEWRMLDAAKEAGLDLDMQLVETGQTLREAIRGEAAAIRELTRDLEHNRDRLAAMERGLQSVSASFVQGMADAEDFGDVAREVLRNVLIELATAQMTMGLGRLFGLPGGSGGGQSFLGALLGGIPSFEGGGDTWSGPRSGGLDGRGGRLALMHPGETVIDRSRGTGPGRPVEVIVSVERGEMFDARVSAISQGQAVRVVRSNQERQRRA